MADAKRFYWLKMPGDFFRQKEIKKLRRIAGGDTFTIIYLKMLLRSMETGGRLYYEGIESNFANELALDIDEDPDNVAITVQFLTANSILQQNTVSEYEMLTAKEMTGSECESARRVRKLRNARRLESGAADRVKALQSNVAVTACNVDIEKEKEIDTISVKRAENDIEIGFDQFWSVYPLKVAKQPALKAWSKLKPKGDLLKSILADVERRVAGEWHGREKQYIPHPATYLNQRRWEDEVADKVDDEDKPTIQELLAKRMAENGGSCLVEGFDYPFGEEPPC